MVYVDADPDIQAHHFNWFSLQFIPAISIQILG